jgi:hypothetical protein
MDEFDSSRLVIPGRAAQDLKGFRTASVAEIIYL